MRFATVFVAAVLAVVAAGCVGTSARNRSDQPWWSDTGGQQNDANDDCRRDRGRVDERKWRAIVDQFSQRTFRKQAGFRQGRDDLLNDLRNVRDRACDWERPAIERLLDRVRDFRYNPNDGSVS